MEFRDKPSLLRSCDLWYEEANRAAPPGAGKFLEVGTISFFVLVSPAPGTVCGTQ